MVLFFIIPVETWVRRTWEATRYRLRNLFRRRTGGQVCAVGVGYANTESLVDIVGGDENKVLTVDSFFELSDIIENLIAQVCNVELGISSSWTHETHDRVLGIRTISRWLCTTSLPCRKHFFAYMDSTSSILYTVVYWLPFNKKKYLQSCSTFVHPTFL